MFISILSDVDEFYQVFKTWSHPLSQSESSILMLYIPLTVLIHQVMVASRAISMFDIEYTNKASVFPLLKALLVCSI